LGIAPFRFKIKVQGITPSHGAQVIKKLGIFISQTPLDVESPSLATAEMLLP
jgi:hypothetical protein